MLKNIPRLECSLISRRDQTDSELLSVIVTGLRYGKTLKNIIHTLVQQWYVCVTS